MKSKFNYMQLVLILFLYPAIFVLLFVIKMRLSLFLDASLGSLLLLVFAGLYYFLVQLILKRFFRAFIKIQFGEDTIDFQHIIWRERNQINKSDIQSIHSSSDTSVTICTRFQEVRLYPSYYKNWDDIKSELWRLNPEAWIIS